MISSRSFVPRLITPAFASALTDALRFSVLAFLVTAGASWLRGSSQTWEEPPALAAQSKRAAVAARGGALVSR